MIEPLQRRAFLKALAASVVAAGCPLPVGMPDPRGWVWLGGQTTTAYFTVTTFDFNTGGPIRQIWGPHGLLEIDECLIPPSRP